jgi:EAL domain-containing protein (putative c-di-GMP-specific phosphodiesterase class I)
MDEPSDLMLILDGDADSRAELCSVAEHLGCSHIETDSVQTMHQSLGTRRPTIAVVAVDGADTNRPSAIEVLANHGLRPHMLFIGSASERILASAKSAAEIKGIPVIGISSRPLDAVEIENLITPHLSVPPTVPRAEMEQALAQGELILLYQPKLAVGNDAMTVKGVEALVRWRHPRRGLLQPRHFLAAVEEFDLTSQLADWVMTDAVCQAGRWRALGMPLEIAVNMSAGSVHDRGFPGRLAILLQENDFPPDQLVLDVTQCLGIEDQDLVLDVFTRLRVLGVGLSLDNFGTGHSSLTELYRMPFSEVKVDHSLVADMPRERETRVIVKAIVNLAHTLRLTVCAEGVENAGLLQLVLSAGFDSAQGLLFSGPVPAEEVERIVRSWPPDVEVSMPSQRVLRGRPEQGVLE